MVNDLLKPRVIVGDCLEVMPTLTAGTVDLVLVDPPYCSGARQEAGSAAADKMVRSGRTWFANDSMNTAGLVWMVRQCALMWGRLLKPGGHVLCFIDWRMYPHLSVAIQSADFQERGLIVWDKQSMALGHFFRNQHEFICHFSKGSPVKALRHDVANVIACKRELGRDKHPTQKPVDLLKTLITVVCPEYGTVLDCFAGSCSTGRAAQESNRFSICIERDPGYLPNGSEWETGRGG